MPQNTPPQKPNAQIHAQNAAAKKPNAHQSSAAQSVQNQSQAHAQALEIYHAELKAIVAKQDYNEHSFRTPFQNLLNALKPSDIRILHEPRAQQGQGSIRPDFKIFKQSAHYEALQGFVECKNYGENLDALIKGRQIEKYLSVCPNIILTDYNRFILLSFGKVVADLTLFAPLESNLFSEQATPKAQNSALNSQISSQKAQKIELNSHFTQLISAFFQSTQKLAKTRHCEATKSRQSNPPRTQCVFGVNLRLKMQICIQKRDKVA